MMGDVLVKRYSAPTAAEQAGDDASERPVAPRPKVKRIGGNPADIGREVIPANSPLFHGEGKEEPEEPEEPEPEYPTKMVKVIKAKRDEHEDMSWEAVQRRAKQKAEREKPLAIREAMKRRKAEESEDEYYYPSEEELAAEEAEDKAKQKEEVAERDRLNAETPPSATVDENVESKEYQGKVKEAVSGAESQPAGPEEKDPEVHAGDDKPAMSTAEWRASPEYAQRQLDREGREGKSTRTGTKQGKMSPRSDTVNVLDTQERTRRGKERQKKQQAIDRKIAQDKKKKLNAVSELPEGGTRQFDNRMSNPPITRKGDEFAPFSPEHEKLFGSKFSKYTTLAGLLGNMITSDPHGTAALWEDIDGKSTMAHLPQYKEMMDGMKTKFGTYNAKGRHIKDKLVEQMMMSMRGGEHNKILDALGLQIGDSQSELEFGQSGPNVPPNEEWLKQQLAGERGEHADPEGAPERSFQTSLMRQLEGMDIPPEHHDEFEEKVREKIAAGSKKEAAYKDVINHMRSMGQIDPTSEISEEEKPYAGMTHGDWQRHDPTAKPGAKRQGPAGPRSTLEEDVAGIERTQNRKERERSESDLRFAAGEHERMMEGEPTIEDEMAASREKRTGSKVLAAKPAGGESLFEAQLRHGVVDSVADFNQMQMDAGTPEKMIDEAQGAGQPPQPPVEDEEEKLASFGGPRLGEQLLKSILKHMYTRR